MKINKSIVLTIFLIFLLAITVTSQKPLKNNSVSVEEAKTCSTNFYDEIESVYGSCVYYHNFTSCLNSSGPNTDCSLQQTQRIFRCKTGEIIHKRNSTECKPLNKFIVSINRGSSFEKKEIDFSSWGACVYNNENNCLIVTCQSRYDGANDGQFHGCKGGTSCQRFQICESSIKVFYKNSRADFVEDDPTFYLPALALKEVGR